jgi:hypothetical protein
MEPSFRQVKEMQFARIKVAHGEIGGEGFAPNTIVEVWVNSEPILLGTVTTDAEGKFSKVFDLPVGLTPGKHTLDTGRHYEERPSS